MAQLIDTTYFVGEISLPGSALSGDLADINSYIAKYERKALIDLIGYTLYKQLKAEIDSTPQTYTDRWSRLVNGYEYEIDYLGATHLVKWNGLINTEKISLLAYYIYYHYVKFHVTNTTKTGEVIAKSENSSKISASQRMVNAWNRYVELRGDPASYRIDPTAYNFLYNFKDDETYGYDPWLFTILKRTNTFGI